MTILSPRHNLFQSSTTADWLFLLQTRLDAHDLAPREALALTGLIHAQLRKPNSHQGAIYASYARAMSTLNHAMPEIHQHVINNWLPPRNEPHAAIESLPDFLADPLDTTSESMNSETITSSEKIGSTWDVENISKGRTAAGT